MKNTYSPTSVSPTFKAKALDVMAFARAGAVLQERGQNLDGFVRLQQTLAEARQGVDDPTLAAESPLLDWEVRGQWVPGAAGMDAQIWLHVRAHCTAPMCCQRCLGLVQVSIEVQRSVRFVADEAQAAMEDEQNEEDVLALNDGSLDLYALLEDELIMAVPLVPRHVQCPTQVSMEFADADFEQAQQARPNPFAALAALRTNDRQS